MVKCYYCGKGIKKPITVRGKTFHPRCYQLFLKYGEAGKLGFFRK